MSEDVTLKSPMYMITPDYTPMVKLMALQTRFALQASQAMMKLAMMPFQAGPMALPRTPAPVAPATKQAKKKAGKKSEAAMAEPVAAVPVAEVPAPAPVAASEVSAPAPVAEVVEAEVVETAVDTPPVADATGPVAPAFLDAPQGEADDLTVLDGVGPKLAATLNEMGVYHLSQIAGWSESNVDWIDANLPGVRGRCARNGWVAQAAALAG
jgi:predicted flap endonuclease-1-like 5' DNA nuclease